MEKKRVHVWITGRVQGVYFRDYTRTEAVKTGVKGWVRNLPDGRVEAIFEGAPDDVDRMVAWCRRGSPLSRVDEVRAVEESLQNPFNGFEIHYYES
ncbi:MAG: acylphosphatase [Syntrophobacteraceae bacterium]|nr:acylphosphatase [Desulfobacteraceae bacterium]